MLQQIKNRLLRHKFEFLFVVLIIYFLVSSFLDSQLSQYVLGLSFAFVMLASLVALSNAKRLLLGSAVTLSVAIFLGFVADSGASGQVFKLVQNSLSAVFLILITGACAQTTFACDRVDAQTLFGALCTYLFMGLTWSEFYVLIHAFDSQSFLLPSHLGVQHFPQKLFTYYSYVTLSTLGFGDITPVSAPARTLSWLEAVIGQAYLTILIAQIVGQFVAQRKDIS